MLDMPMPKGWFDFFQRSRVVVAKNKKAWFEEQLSQSELANKFPQAHITQSQSTTRVYYNHHYFEANNAPLSLHRALTQTAGFCIDGDRQGLFQDGRPIPRDFYKTLTSGSPHGLSPDERLTAGKKIIASNSWVFAYGGYPHMNPRKDYTKPFQIGIFSQAGAQFENDYLHYRLFGLDHVNQRFKNPHFAHLYDGMPAHYAEAKQLLSLQGTHHDFSHIRVGFPFLARRATGRFYSSMFRNNAIVFLSKAYERFLLEDIDLLLTAVNDTAKTENKPAFLKATAVGMGYFARVNKTYPIENYLYPYYLRVFRQLLQDKNYPFIAKIEFPIFSPVFEQFYGQTFPETAIGHINVCHSSRDTLLFSAEEQERYFVCAINPSDANALPGNGWGDKSVESALFGNNTSLRFDQVYLVNESMLNPERHIMLLTPEPKANHEGV